MAAGTGGGAGRSGGGVSAAGIGAIDTLGGGSGIWSGTTADDCAGFDAHAPAPISTVRIAAACLNIPSYPILSSW